MDKLAQALDTAAYKWLSGMYPEIAEAVKAELQNGATPDEIRRFVGQYAENQTLATNCARAARFIKAQLLKND